jgi:hypothetical protein
MRAWGSSLESIPQSRIDILGVPKIFGPLIFVSSLSKLYKVETALLKCPINSNSSWLLQAPDPHQSPHPQHQAQNAQTSKRNFAVASHHVGSHSLDQSIFTVMH